MKKRPVIITALALSCLLVGTITIIMLRGRSSDRLRTPARKEWKENAIAEIARRSSESNWLATEAKLLKAKLAKPEPEEGDWLSDQLLLMKNEEWMVYANKCSKEDNRIHDIFIARGSNGKWYYSTFHFCIGMIVPKMMDEQPDSLAAFVERYFLVGFDGRSDECLKKTWPPKRQ